MRRNLLMAVLSVAVVGLSWKGIWQSSASGSPTGTTAAATSVGLVDLLKVFKEHAKFNERTNALRKEVELAEVDLKTRRAELAKLPEGSEKAAELKEALNYHVNLKKVEFGDRDALLYHEEFEEVTKAVQRFADARGIALVVRYHEEAFDLKKPKTILDELNRTVLYHHGIDITDDIIRILNAKADD